MSTEDSPGSDRLNAIAALAREIPIYQDAIQPMAQETGKALAVVGRAVNVALMPIRGLVWGAEQVETWVAERVTQKLKDVSEDKIVPPDVSIAGPIIEALKFTGHKDELSEMFAALLAGAMNSETQVFSHPIFAEKVKTMSSLDARIFKEIASKRSAATLSIVRSTEGVEGFATISSHQCPEFHEIALELKIAPGLVASMVEASVENLQGLALVQAPRDRYLTGPKATERYKVLQEDWAYAQSMKSHSRVGEYKIEAEQTYVQLTSLGSQFYRLINI